jgi:hypothetical protein
LKEIRIRFFRFSKLIKVVKLNRRSPTTYLCRLICYIDFQTKVEKNGTKAELAIFVELNGSKLLSKIGTKRNMEYKELQNILFEYERKSADDSDLSLV